MSKGTLKPSFEYFREFLINEQDRLIASSHFSNSKDLMAHSKKRLNITLKKTLNHIIDGQLLLMMMLLTWCLTKRKCIVLVSIVEKQTTMKIFAFNRDVNL